MLDHNTAPNRTSTEEQDSLSVVEVAELSNSAKKGRNARQHRLPELTSAHQTRLPSSNGMRGLIQSYGPGLQPSLWNETWGHAEGVKELQMSTPNDSLLRVFGKNDSENKALQYYIVEEMGVEGLKHLIILLNAYYTQTDANNRKDDARVSLRQLLIQMGYEKRADEKALQWQLMRSILYLSRTWIRSTETSYEQEKRGPGRRRRQSVEYSPLIVIETMKPGEDGSLQLPEAVEFHLGKEFYDLLFGERKHFFAMPTLPILRYHADREQHEICLAFYLSNFINMNGGRYEVYFPEMISGSGIRLAEDIAHGHDRTRDAMQVIYAAEHLQKDLWIIRDAHPDIDIAIAVELFTGMYKRDDLSEETCERVTERYAHLKALPPAELRRRRREALQRLLDGQSEKIRFKAGPLIKEQAEKRETQRTQAIERNERAQIARVVNIATKRVVKNIEKESK